MRPTLLAFSLTGLLAGCATPEPTPADEQPFSSICDESNVGRRVGVRGYLQLPMSNTGDFSVVLRLFETPEYSGQPIGVSVRIGPDAHEMDQLPGSYTHEDLHVRAADGTAVGYGDAVQVSGEVYVPTVEQDFPCGLQNVFVTQG